MSHPDLIKKFNDAEYSRRYNRLFFLHALSLLPLLVFIVVVWCKSGTLVAAAVYLCGASYVLTLLGLRILWRRDVLSGMRREGMIDMTYKPPLL